MGYIYSPTTANSYITFKTDTGTDITVINMLEAAGKNPRNS